MTNPDPPRSWLSELEEAEKKATPGPWVSRQPIGMGANTCIYSGSEKEAGAYADWSPIAERVTGDANTQFILLSRNRLPALLKIARAALARHQVWTRETYVQMDEALREAGLLDEP